MNPSCIYRIYYMASSVGSHVNLALAWHMWHALCARSATPKPRSMLRFAICGLRQILFSRQTDYQVTRCTLGRGSSSCAGSGDHTDAQSGRRQWPPNVEALSESPSSLLSGHSGTHRRRRAPQQRAHNGRPEVRIDITPHLVSLSGMRR